MSTSGFLVFERRFFVCLDLFRVWPSRWTSSGRSGPGSNEASWWGWSGGACMVVSWRSGRGHSDHL